MISTPSRSVCRLVLPLLLVLAGSLPALAQATTYGSGCSDLFPEPTISHSGSTTPGVPGFIHLTGGQPFSIAVLLIGDSNTFGFGQPLPWDIGFVGGVAAGCTLQTSAQFQLIVNTDGAGNVTFPFPNLPQLGDDLYFQWGVYESLAPANLVFTQGLHLKLTNTLTPDVGVADLGAETVGSIVAKQIVTVSNPTDVTLSLVDAVISGPGAADFEARLLTTPPVVLPPAGTTDIELILQPMSTGKKSATVQLVQSPAPPSGFPIETIELVGVGLGPPGSEIIMNAGGGAYVDGGSQTWSPDFGSTGGSIFESPDPVTGTTEQTLYQQMRAGSSFSYTYPLPNGTYDVTLHFADPDSVAPGERVFDVRQEGSLALDDLDLFALVGQDAAHQATLPPVALSDGFLSLVFNASAGDAIVSAIEVRQRFATLDVAPAGYDFGAFSIGQSSSIDLTLTNTGNDTLNLSTLEFNIGPGGGAGHEFLLDINGTIYTGDHEDVTLPATLVMAPQEVKLLPLTFAPTEHQDNDIDLVFNGNFPSVTVPLAGFGGSGTGGGFLHVVIQPVTTPVDYDGDGFETVMFDGSFSHTHEPGKSLAVYTWKEGPTVLGTGQFLSHSFPVGPHTVSLTIEDNDVPPDSLTDSVTFEVHEPDSVPEVLALYYQSGAQTPQDLLDNVPANADFAELRQDMSIVDEGAIGGSPWSENIMVRLLADLNLDTGGVFTFKISGGADSRLLIDGSPATVAWGIGGTGGSPGRDSMYLPAGQHSIEARFAITDIGDLPAEVTMGQSGAPTAPIDPELLTHDETELVPVINAMPTVGFTLGGNAIDINGLGFFPANDVTVHWGGSDLSGPDFNSQSPTLIELTAPPHPEGVIQITVETPQGVSNVVDFTYDVTSTPPILFDQQPHVVMASPTSGAWGPDGRLYVSTLFGRIFAITFDQDYVATDVEDILALQPLANDDILGIAFNPFDPPDPVKLYVSHCEIYAQNGDPPTGFFEYNGKVTVLTGPTFDLGTAETLISGLPVSNHDHGNNGIVFDNNGDLLIAIGGATNAGIVWPEMGLLPESPLSAAILKAETSRPDFNGVITYVETDTGLPNDDARDGWKVDVAPGIHVDVHAPGLRNPYDLVYTTKKRLYATDNGPNVGFGPELLGPSSAGPDPVDTDELMYVEYDNYYGHPNPNRGRYDLRQWTHHFSTDPEIPGVFKQSILPVSSSTGGLAEYRAKTFSGQLRGHLLSQRWNGSTKRVVLSPDGRSVVSSNNLTPNISPLDVVIGPGGAILGIDYSSNRVTPLTPNDLSVTGMTVHDIFPRRAPSTGGYPFVIGGENFGTLGDTTVTIGGLPATVTSVTSRRIEGIVPAQPTPTTALLNVSVDSNGESDVLTAAFRYLYPTPGLEPGGWENGTVIPIALGEVGSGVIDGKLYVVGANSFKTWEMDIATGVWAQRPNRPFPGDHHAVEVIDDKLYLFGGHENGADGKVQIFDPQTESWTTGTDMPWAGISVSTALIDGLVYVSGGIVGNSTVDDCAVYDPVLDSWTTLASMPAQKGRNHAAAGTDGEKFWIFGGRGFGSGDGNEVANGFADVQVYDPVTDTWEASFDIGSSLVPMPIGRGGTGKAVWYQDEFYVFGGETATGPGATPAGTYDRVDVYDPETNTWRLEAPMPTARHGHFPVLFESRIFIAGGGSASGLSFSEALEIFTRQ
ncbi:MAG: Kelch repeat-containing protein [Planctomycetota bacterium]|jgi:N-acetylneuraminic acid mutarotase/glucose/arabinose dehydrogenase